MESPTPDSIILEPLLSPGFTCRVDRPIDEVLVRDTPPPPPHHTCVLSLSSRAHHTGAFVRTTKENVLSSFFSPISPPPTHATI